MRAQERRLGQRVGEPLRVCGALDQRPVQHGALVVVAGPFHVGHGDAAVRAALNRLEHVRVAQRRDVTLALEARLDAAESVPWLLDVVFAVAGRVRPYNKYLPWELRTHPVDGWPAEELLALVRRTLDGDVQAIRETFPRVRAACAAYDERRGHTLTGDMVDGWGDQLAVFG